MSRRDSISVGYGAGTSTTSSSGGGGGSGSGADGDGNLFGMIFGGGYGSGRRSTAPLAVSTPSFMAIIVIVSVVYSISNTDDLLSWTFSPSN